MLAEFRALSNRVEAGVSAPVTHSSRRGLSWPVRVLPDGSVRARDLLVLVVVLFFEPSLVHVGMGVCAVAMVVLMVMLGMLVAVLTMGVRMRGTLMLVLVSVTLSMVVI